MLLTVSLSRACAGLALMLLLLLPHRNFALIAWRSPLTCVVVRAVEQIDERLARHDLDLPKSPEAAHD